MDETQRTQLILPLSRQKLAGNKWLDLLGDDDRKAELGFMARLLVQATMPHSNPGDDITVWSRQNGALFLDMQAGVSKGRSVGLPYGSYPRLLLSWLTTEAVRTKDRELVLGESLSAFMNTLGLIPAGGRWGTISRLRDQMRRLFSAIISVHVDGPGMEADASFKVADRTITFWDPRSPDQAALWRSTVTLSEGFYNEVTSRPVPLDMAVLQAFTRSPMAIDIYIWLTYRMSYMRHSTTIPWGALEMQFGADYTRVRDFRAKFLKALKKVLLVYPAQVAATPEGLVLAPSRTHIPRRF